MIKPVVVVSVLAFCAGAPVWAQEGGAAGVAVERPDRVQVLPEHKPKPDMKGMVGIMVAYPAAAKRKRIEGDVTVSMCVNEQGRARDVTLVKSSGNEALDSATLKGMEGLKFEPGRDAEGKIVDWCDPPYQVTLSWRLPKY